MANRSLVFFRFCLPKLTATNPSTGRNRAAYNGAVPLPPGGGGTARDAVFRNVWIVINTLPDPGVAGGALNWQVVPAGWPLQLKFTAPSGTVAFMVIANVAVSPWNAVTFVCIGVRMITGHGGM